MQHCSQNSAVDKARDSTHIAVYAFRLRGLIYKTRRVEHLKCQQSYKHVVQQNTDLDRHREMIRRLRLPVGVDLSVDPRNQREGQTQTARYVG